MKDTFSFMLKLWDLVKSLGSKESKPAISADIKVKDSQNVTVYNVAGDMTVASSPPPSQNAAITQETVSQESLISQFRPLPPDSLQGYRRQPKPWGAVMPKSKRTSMRDHFKDSTWQGW